jgi:hypothetical protein
MNSDPSIRIINPRRLSDWHLPAERIPLGIPNDYKPSLAILPDGELVMVAFYPETRPDGSYHEWTVLWRSSDGGQTWSERTVLEDVIGREQWLTATSEGALFMTSHLLPRDTSNPDDVVHGYLHRSVDGGKSWERTQTRMPDGRPAHTSRNVVEETDGSLRLGVSCMGTSDAHFWRSDDSGATWVAGDPVTIGDYRGQPYDNLDSFFAEDFTFRTDSGKLLHWIRCGPPSPMYPMNNELAVPVGNDQGDRSMICESVDDGRMWDKLRDFGDYGMMYVRVIRLQDGRLLLTYTRRALRPPLGLRAILSEDEGETWNFEHDQILIEGKTPWGMASGGGFGNTVQLADGALVSAYSYRTLEDQTRVEVVRWSIP